MGGANPTNFTKYLEGDKFELWSDFFNVRGMACHMGSFYCSQACECEQLGTWGELRLSPLLPSLQNDIQPQYSSMDQTSVEQSFDFFNNSLWLQFFK
jgi:hypothetical protein